MVSRLLVKWLSQLLEMLIEIHVFRMVFLQNENADTGL